MPTNDFLVYAPQGGNVLDQTSYLADSHLLNGVVPGTGNPLLYNKSQRQITIMASMIAQFIVQQANVNTIDDGTTATLLADFVKALGSVFGNRYSFDAAAPPAQPILLLPGDFLTITHSGQSSVPMRVTSQPGLYRITWVITASSSTENNIALAANGVLAPSIDSWAIESTDTGTSSSPFIAQNTATWVVVGSNFFLLDMFWGPFVGGDTINDRGPLTIEMLVSTYSAAKMIQYRGGETGGGSVGFSLWRDTATAWSLLGTLSVGANSPSNGTVSIERLV